MHAPVAHLARELLVPAEVVRRGRVLVRTERARPEPLVPVEPLRGLARGALADAVREEVGDARGAAHAERAVLAAVDLALQLAVDGAAAAVEAHAHDLLRRLLRVHHRAALGDRGGERLLAVDVLAGLDRVDRHDRVPVVGRRDVDRVDVRVLEEAAVVRVELARARLHGVEDGLFLREQLAVLVVEDREAALEAPFKELRVERGFVALEVRVVDVAEGRDLHVGLAHEQVQHLRAAVAHADKAHAHLLGCRGGANDGGGGGRHGGAGLDEISSLHVCS